MKYTPKPEDIEKLENICRYHPVQGDDQAKRYEANRAAAEEFGKVLLKNCPPSRELSIAINHLQAALMFSNGAIAIHEAGEQP